MRAVILPLTTAAVLLSGCTALDDFDRRMRAALEPQPATSAPSEAFQPLPERKPTDVPPPKRQAPRRVAPTAPAPAMEAPKPERAPMETEPDTAQAAVTTPPPDPDAPIRGKLPEELVGISAEQLRARFGAPDQEIEETPGVTWRYRPNGCVLDIHMFPRVESQGLYALDVSSRRLSVDECLKVLMNPPGAEPAAEAAAEAQSPAPDQPAEATTPE